MNGGEEQHPYEPADLHRMVEGLALDLVMSGSEAGPGPQRVAEALSAIRKTAEASGNPDAARLAAALSGPIDEVLAGRSEWPAVEAALQNDLVKLQQAVAAAGGSTPPAAAPGTGLGDDPELVNDFVLETGEHLASIEVHLLRLEKEPRDADSIHSIFRSFHTIKGLAGFLELQEIRDVAHEVETILDLARTDQLRVTPPVIDVVLASADFLKLWVDALQARLAGLPSNPPACGNLLVQIRSLREDSRDAGPAIGKPPAAEPVGAGEAAAAGVTAGEHKAVPEARTVKVDTAKLDALVDMVGEMVIAQSLVKNDPDLATIRTPKLLRNLSQLARTTDELQKTAMSMRMVPIGQLFQKMSRLTRDLGRKSGKQVEMLTVGEDTELDRNLVEELADPLMHMVRNAVDHGLEDPEERAAAGKPPVGTVRLSACHQAGHILIELADDGRGLNREKILAKARERGLIDNAANLPDQEVHSLIFRPGFSTAEKVTDVSGRGVGMDVVRKQIQKLRGRVEIRSVPGAGTTFILKLPLTLAIIDGLVVSVGEERFIVPLFSVREVLRPTEEMVNTIEGRSEMALVRNHLVPIVRLYRRFSVKPKSEDPCQGVLVISETAQKVFGLMVDELIGKQEVVIKNLGETLKNLPGIAGGAILGDGRVGLVLDTDGLFGVRETNARG